MVLQMSVPTLAQERGRRRSTAGRMYKATIRPHWFADNTRFWYLNELRGGAWEVVVVDAVAGVRKAALHQKRLAQALRDAEWEETRIERRDVRRLEFEESAGALIFRARGREWSCDLGSFDVREVRPREGGVVDGIPPLSPEDAPRASTRTGAETAVTFVNRTEEEVELYWLATNGERRSYGKLPAGEEREQHTYAGHVWVVVGADGRVVAIFRAEDAPDRAVITGKAGVYRRRRPGSSRRPGRRQAARDESPDGKWSAFVRDGNVWVRSREDGAEHELSKDGTEEESYGRLEWAPDSKTLVAFRITPGDRKEVYLIESSPPGGGRAKLRTRPYDLPGDRLASYELSLFDVTERSQTKPQVDPVDLGSPRLRWKADGHRFTYEKTDRGHQRFRLIEIDTHTGDSRAIIDETTETFIWTAHTENLRLRRIHWLPDTGEIIYVSERDGWRHLYLVDAEAGKIKNAITRGEYVVRAVDRIDEESRQIWFQASGRNPDQDPYLLHFYRVDFDGSGLVALTEGNGQHSIQYSPDGGWLIDTYSRVDRAPVHELRRVSDGKLVCGLEEADTSELEERGWKPPEVFMAKGRDGKTDIWGIICPPGDLDPSRKYPVIEDIYAGPQSSYVPKTFRPSERYRELTDLGFVVVKIDGMGTANRSKAFHDVCWKNLKDAGLPDRICWMRAAAEERPWMDITRVGIYGTSAGGQSAAGAVLFHPEFYKAAVASCGCHDNRMDKLSWNEQWMGYPVGPHYAACSNIENAHRLQGHLMLIVGELDTNVPPESTLRLADSLIKAGKDFDLIVIPGAGHGDGGSYGRRRRIDFFLRHLKGVEPPDRNAPESGG